MALSLAPTTTYHQSPPHTTSNPTTLCRYPSNLFLSPITTTTTFHLHRSSLLFPTNPNSWSRWCRAASPGPPPPTPESDSPTGNEPSSSSGIASTASRFQETAQIFFAVLFWMSLFFWASAWDGRNNGRPSKGSRSRR